MMRLNIKKQLILLTLSNIIIIIAILVISAYLLSIVEHARENQAAADRIVKLIQQARIAEKAYRQHYLYEYRHAVIQKTEQARSLLPGIIKPVQTGEQDQSRRLIDSYEATFADMIGFHDRNMGLTQKIRGLVTGVQTATKTFMDVINRRQFNARTLHNRVLDRMESGLLSPLQDVNYLSVFLLLNHQRFLGTNDPGHLMDFYTYFDEYGPGLFGAIKQGAAYLDNAVYQNLAAKIQTDLKSANQLLEKSHGLMNDEESSARRLDRIGIDLEIQTARILQTATGNSKDAKTTAVRLAFLIFLAGSTLILTISIYLTSSITRPLENLIGAANAISRGDLSIKIPTGPHNEFTRLGAAFNNMTNHLSRARALLETEVSERKNAEMAVKKMSHRIILSQEMERAAVARELHDELGQVLTALKIDAVWLKRHSPFKEPRCLKRIEQMCDFIDKSFDDVKGLALRLRPKVLDDMGLAVALRWLGSDFETRNGIKCNVLTRDLEMNNDTVSTALYRIAQECLTNIVRHARATRVQLTLKTTNDSCLHLMVEDNGQGFDKNKINGKEALGIAGMIERARLINASFQIDSKPGQGCTVNLVMNNLNRGSGDS